MKIMEGNKMENNNNSNLNKNIELEHMIDNFSNMNTEIEKKLE